MATYLPCNIFAIDDLNIDSSWDTVCVVDKEPGALSSIFNEHRVYDKAFDSVVSCFKDPTEAYRIVYSPIGQLDDFDDVRVYANASGKALARAINAGGKSIVLVLPEVIKTGGKYHFNALQMVLGALHELYVPIQLREEVSGQEERIDKLGIYHKEIDFLKNVLDQATKYEQGRFVARDIGGGDPERMTPSKVQTYVETLFASSSISVDVISDPAVFIRDYPLFAAVNRAAQTVPRHCGRIIQLRYRAPETPTKTLILIGKGVTYDTGGADIKAGGIMAGMSRDKCGAAFVSGFMKYVNEISPKYTDVIGIMCMVRNSIGEECFVSDEIITARSGVRVRVGNTDAEGRMAMADALYYMKQKALTLPDPHLYTIATLTGHAFLAVGEGYSIVMDNGPARNIGHGAELKKVGDIIGDPFEVSTIQREDFTAHRSTILGENVIQANNLPSSRTPRGHQTPAAFLMLASGLDKHGSESEAALKYSHIDIAASAGEFPEKPTGSPLLAMAHLHLKNE